MIKISLVVSIYVKLGYIDAHEMIAIYTINGRFLRRF